MKTLFTFLSLLLIACGPPLPLTPPEQGLLQQQSPPENKWFKIIVLDVGQGDATLLIAPNGEAAAIDTGPRDVGNQAILKTLDEQSIPTLKNIFISHYHDDHIGGLPKVLAALNMDATQVIDKTNAVVGQIFSLGPITIQVKAANGHIGNSFQVPADAKEDENNFSDALLIQYGNIRYFTSGDLPGGGGTPPYDTLDLETPLAPLVGDIDLFLVPHHGSHTSTNENFLNQLKPEVGIISLGNGNEFFHPHPSVMQRLKSHGVKIYQTEKGALHDTDGVEIVNESICILIDGDTYLIKPYAVDKCASPS